VQQVGALSPLITKPFLSKMSKSVYHDYIEQKGYTVQECYRSAKKEVPDHLKHRYSSYAEYQEALHDYLNGM